MRATVIVAIILILFGVVSLAYQGITYTTKEKVIDIGPIEASTETKKTIPLPPLLGGLALACGGVLIVLAARKT